MLDSDNQAVPTGTGSDRTHPAVPEVPVQAGPSAVPPTATPAPAVGGVAARERWPFVVWLGVAGAGIVGAVAAKAVAAAVLDTALANVSLVAQAESGTYRLLAALMVVALAGCALIRRPWNGWPLAAVGSAVAFASTTAQARSSVWYMFGFVVGAGAALAGTLAAVAATPSAAHRRVLSAALAVGFVAAGELTRLTHWGNVAAKDALAATLVTVALFVYGLVRRSPVAGAAEGRAGTGAGRYGWLRRAPVAVVLAAVVTLGLDEALRLLDRGLRSGRAPGGPHDRVAELATHYGHILITLVVTVALVVLAWRAGGYRQARWLIVGAGLAALLYSGPNALGDLSLSPLGGWSTLALPAGAALGALLVWYVAGAVPWDAYALVIGAVATVVVSVLPDGVRTAHTASALSHMALVAFAIALGAGITEVASDDTAPGSWSGAVGLGAGFAAFVLVAAQFAVDPLVTVSLSDRGSLYGAAVAVACAACAWAVTVRMRRRTAVEAAGPARTGEVPDMHASIPGAVSPMDGTGQRG